MRVMFVLFASALAVTGLGAAPRLARAEAPPATSAAAPFDARTVATALAERLQSDFVYAAQGRRYAEALQAKSGAGAYDALEGEALAKRLTDDLQGVAPDGHLRVFFGPPGGPPLRPPEGARATVRTGTARAPMPPAMELASWISPGVAFVRFNLFPGDPDSANAAARFVATHADAKTIIFDIRTHRGGGLAEMDVIFPWLFGKPTRLVAMATRKSVDEAGGSPMGDGPTLRRVDADPDFVTREHWATPGRDGRLRNAKVYVLTSPATGSAAEHFALALKRTQRAVLIGRATAGANHFGGILDLGGGFSAFIPVGRTYDPDTGRDWEGVGVLPDIDVAPEDALVKALTLSGVAPDKAAELSNRVAPSMPMVRRR